MIFTKGQTIKTVFFQIDKKTAFTYLLNMGGASSSTLITITKKIWGILMSKGATSTVDYLQIALDQKAEWQSSYIQDSFEWKLLPQIFRKRSQVLRQPKIDLSLVKSNSTLLLIETGPPKAKIQSLLLILFRLGTLTMILRNIRYSHRKPTNYREKRNASEEFSRKGHLLVDNNSLTLVHGKSKTRFT